jgi:hypothetical protein
LVYHDLADIDVDDVLDAFLIHIFCYLWKRGRNRNEKGERMERRQGR